MSLPIQPVIANRLARTRRRSLVLAPVWVGALLAGAACRTSSSGPSSGSGAAANPTASPTPVTIELLAGLTPSQHATHQALVVDPFQQVHPNVRLLTVDAPAAQVDQKLLALVAGGTPPDVMFNAPPYLHLGGLTQDLTIHVRRDRYPTSSFVKEGFESAAMWRGRIVNLPYYFGGHSSVLPYNRELFQRAGVPEPPVRWGTRDWNADSWLHALKRTTQSDSTDAVRSYGVNVTSVTFYAYYLSTLWNGAWLSPDMRRVTCDSTPMVEAFEYFAGLATYHGVAASGPQLAAAFGSSSAEAAFLGGKLATYATPGAQNVTAVAEAVRTRGQPFSFAPLPTFKTFGAAHYYVGNGIVHGSRSPDVAWSYAKWAAGTPNWCISRGQPPARSDLFEPWAASAYNGIAGRVRLDVLQESLRHPLSLDPLFHVPAQQRVPMVDLIQSTLDRMWSGEVAPTPALRALSARLQPLLPRELPD